MWICWNHMATWPSLMCISMTFRWFFVAIRADFVDKTPQILWLLNFPKKTVTICSWLFTWGWWHRAKCIWTKKSSIFPSRIKPRKIRGHRLGWLWNPDVSLSFFVAWLHHYKASHPVRRKSPENFKKSLSHLEGSSTQAFQGLFVKPLLFHL